MNFQMENSDISICRIQQGRVSRNWCACTTDSFTSRVLLSMNGLNGGGQLADRFMELLTRPVVYNLHWRHGRDHTQPVHTNTGPMGMLINGWAGSGGDGPAMGISGTGRRTHSR